MHASLLLVGVLLGQVGNGAGWKKAGAPATEIDVKPLQVETKRDKPADQSQVIRSAHVTVAVVKKQGAADLLAELLRIPAKSQIGGDETSLLDVIRLKSGLPAQREAVVAYWKLSRAIAEYHWRQQAHLFLKKIEAPADDKVAQVALLAELASARAAAGKARLAVLKAQMALGKELDDEAEHMIVPRDQPLVGRYLTRFEEIYDGRKAPRKIRNIDRLLPVLYQSTKDYTAAVQASREAVGALLEAYKAKRGKLAEVLAYHRQLTRNGEAFLAAVYSYNTNIAHYALAVAPEDTSTRLVVSMLIKTTPTATTPPRRRDVQHASSHSPVRRSTKREKSGWVRRR